MNFPKINFNLKTTKTHVNVFENDLKIVQKLCKNIQLSKIASIFIPENSSLELLDQLYYTIDQFKISDLLSKNFINGYVLNGDLCMSSSFQDNENCQILISDKKLTVKLDRELYYSLTAVHLAKFRKKSNDEFFETFEVDLTAESACKIQNELMSDKIDKLFVNFAWNPEAKDVCSSSLAKFFTDMEYKVNEQENQYCRNVLYSIKIPPIPSSKTLCDDNYEEWSALIEVISMAMIGCSHDEMSINDSPDYTKVKKANVLHYKGFIPNNVIQNLFEKIQETLKENRSIPYIAASFIPYSILQKNFKAKLVIITSESIYASE